ncbi:MAG: TonB-dependent receptor [Verrucomicrobiota bacterium]
MGGGQLAARLNTFYQRGENTFDSEIVGTATSDFSVLGLPTIPAVAIPNAFIGPFGAIIYPIGGGFDPDSELTQAFRQTVNRAETEIYGAEFTVDYDHDDWFAAMTAGTVRGEDTTTGQKLNSITGDQLSLTLGIRPLDNVEIGAYGIWNGGLEERVAPSTLANVPDPQTAGYDIYGLFATWQVTECWSLRMGVDNLLNQEHQRTNLLLPEPGRNYFFSSTIHF